MLLYVIFRLLKSRDRVIYEGTEETVQKVQLQESGDASALWFGLGIAQTSCGISSRHSLGGEGGVLLQRGRDLHDQITFLRAQLNSLEFRGWWLGMLPGVLGWSQSGTTGASEPGAAAWPQPHTLSSGWRWTMLSPESLTGQSARAGKVPLLQYSPCLSNKKTPKLNLPRQGCPGQPGWAKECCCLCHLRRRPVFGNLILQHPLYGSFLHGSNYFTAG